MKILLCQYNNYLFLYRVSWSSSQETSSFSCISDNSWNLSMLEIAFQWLMLLEKASSIIISFERIFYIIIYSFWTWLTTIFESTILKSKNLVIANFFAPTSSKIYFLFIDSHSSFAVFFTLNTLYRVSNKLLSMSFLHRQSNVFYTSIAISSWLPLYPLVIGASFVKNLAKFKVVK